MRFLTRYLFGCLFIFCLMSFGLKAQSITGNWYGVLEIRSSPLRLQLTVDSTAEGLKATMISLDQSRDKIPVDSIRLENGQLFFIIKAFYIEYEGAFVANRDSIEGTFIQRRHPNPLKFGRSFVTKMDSRLRRPQDPSPYAGYFRKEVKFINEEDHVTLAGTLTYPAIKKGPFPAVILISGSGPQNRNEELMNHRPFAVWADYLTKHGIAVLRYDDRGTAESGGNYASAGIPEFVKDAEAAFKFLQQQDSLIDVTKIGLIGHSEGGIVAPMLASRNHAVAFVVSLAGLGINGVDLLADQNYWIYKSEGISEDTSRLRQQYIKELGQIVIRAPNRNEIPKLAAHVLDKLYDISLKPGEKAKQSRVAYNAQTALAVSTASMLGILKTDPSTYLPKVTCPVLAVNGSKDIQVPAKENIEGFQYWLAKGGNKQVTTKIFDQLNHLFQHCKTCTIGEYAEIDETVAPEVLEFVTGWISKITAGDK
ncbi:alpha/beta hydrolase [Chitinophaga caeni]|uniref:Alpha/beta hydrolase n=1 Tax=Chitinophaga caeni TaxID=2029983 RepID=A0A291QVF5_9BACT|nr:alpha/beta hydrolase [Chitinophaga caeni]ATL47834.1 alpha/beta hydrolase [Chitinophaga caeni]